MTDFIAGTVQMMIEVMPSALPQVQGGKLRGLGVTTEKRWPLAKDIPTMGEAGMKRVADHFGVGRLLSATLDAYKKAQRVINADQTIATN